MEAKILIVDDEENHRKTLGIGLRLEGFSVTEAADGEDGLSQLEREPADLAIVDLMMPGMSGLEFARRVRFHHPRTRVILTSAYHLTERQLERAAAGIIGFVAKPYSLDELVSFLSRKLSQPPPASLSA